MNYRDLTTPAQPVILEPNFEGMARQILGESFGFTTDARRQETPHIVDVDGLSRAHLTKPGEFEREFAHRLAWCKQYAPDFAIEPIGPNPKGLVGKRFRFRDISIAALFRGTFPTDLTSGSEGR